MVMLEVPLYTREARTVEATHRRVGNTIESEGIEMSDDQPENVAPVVAPILRREALLPNERSRGLGTVAVVCTMAGVASGLALATTLMAMQVADSMSSRACPYRNAPAIARDDARSDHGFLGIRYVFHDGFADVESVLPGTPAEAVDLRPNDHVLSINRTRIRSADELKDQIFYSHPGATPSLVIERQGEVMTLHPTLVAWPSISY
jgi:S1-C subfamily serine protease